MIGTYSLQIYSKGSPWGIIQAENIVDHYISAKYDTLNHSFATYRGNDEYDVIVYEKDAPKNKATILLKNDGTLLDGYHKEVTESMQKQLEDTVYALLSPFYDENDLHISAGVNIPMGQYTLESKYSVGMPSFLTITSTEQLSSGKEETNFSDTIEEALNTSGIQFVYLSIGGITSGESSLINLSALEEGYNRKRQIPPHLFKCIKTCETTIQRL